MLRRAKVLGRMLVLGLVATADMAAGSAEAKVYPGISHGEALLAPGGVGGVSHYKSEVAAMGRHDITPDWRLTTAASRDQAAERDSMR